MSDTISLVAMQQGIVHFGAYPDAALLEVARRHALASTDADRTILVNRMRTHLLHTDGEALTTLLRDLHDAALRYGADDAVELTTIG